MTPPHALRFRLLAPAIAILCLLAHEADAQEGLRLLGSGSITLVPCDDDPAAGCASLPVQPFPAAGASLLVCPPLEPRPTEPPLIEGALVLGGGLVQGVALRLAPFARLRTGTYALRIGLSRPGEPAAVCDTNLSLQRPAANATADQTLAMTVVEGEIVDLGEGGGAQGIVHLVVNDGAAGLAPLRVYEALPLRHENGLAQSAHLIATPGETEIDAPGSGSIAVSVAGDLRLGRSTATLALAAPQLAAPLLVSVSVFKQISVQIVLLVILAGLILGELVRKVLEPRKAYHGAMQHAQSRLVAWHADAAREPDPGVRSQLQNAIGRLQADLATAADAAAIEAATTACRTAMDEALASAAERRTATRAAVEQEVKDLAGLGALPAEVQGPVAAWQARLDLAREDLDRGLVDEPQQRIAGHRASAQAAIRDAARDWASRATIAINALQPWQDVAALNGVLASQLPALASIGGEEQAVVAARLSGQAWRTLRSALAGHGAAIERHLDAVAAVLGITSVSLAQARQRLARLPADDVVGRLRALRDVYDTAVALAGRREDVDLAKLREGRLAEALGIGAVPVSPAPAPGAPESAALEGIARPRTFGPTRPAVPQVQLLLEPADARTGDTLLASVVGVPEGASIRWAFHGPARVLGETADDAPQFRIQALARGPLTVSVTVESPGGLDSLRRTVEVSPSTEEQRSAESAKGVWRTQAALVVVSAVLVTGLGLVIFQDVAFDDYWDLFVPFLWGFSVELGLAQVRGMLTDVSGLRPRFKLPG